MKVTIERAELLKSLGHVHRVVERRNTIPILANVLVRAEKSSLSLKATDLDLEVIESIAAEVAPAGSTTVGPQRGGGRPDQRGSRGPAPQRGGSPRGDQSRGDQSRGGTGRGGPNRGGGADTALADALRRAGLA